MGVTAQNMVQAVFWTIKLEKWGSVYCFNKVHVYSKYHGCRPKILNLNLLHQMSSSPFGVFANYFNMTHSLLQICLCHLCLQHMLVFSWRTWLAMGSMHVDCTCHHVNLYMFTLGCHRLVNLILVMPHAALIRKICVHAFPWYSILFTSMPTPCIIVLKDESAWSFLLLCRSWRLVFCRPVRSHEKGF